MTSQGADHVPSEYIKTISRSDDYMNQARVSKKDKEVTKWKDAHQIPSEYVQTIIRPDDYVNQINGESSTMFENYFIEIIDNSMFIAEAKHENKCK